MKKKIKMIGLDLDGTLLNDRKEISLHTQTVLARAIAQGVVVLAATGRPLCAVPEELRQFPGMRYILTANGARVIDQSKNEVLFEKLLPIAKAEKILDILAEYDTLKEAFCQGTGYIDEELVSSVDRYMNVPHMADYILTTRKPVPNLREYVSGLSDDLDKINAIFADLAERERAFQRLRQVIGITLTSSLPNNIEINHEGVNKGLGLIELGRYLGIEREEIMCCGDGLNDVEMVQQVGFGVAMANGIKEVKDQADYITETNNEDGVAGAIEKFVLI